MREKDIVFNTYERRAIEFLDKGYRTEVWYIGYKLLSDWTLLSRIDIKGKRVLNVGCSEPIDEMFWVRKVGKWVAVDYSPKSIEVARKIIKKELSKELSELYWLMPEICLLIMMFLMLWFLFQQLSIFRALLTAKRSFLK